MVLSMSRTANWYDNAVTESLFHSFKGECVDREVFQTRTQARRATFDDLECFYNRTRRHLSNTRFNKQEFKGELSRQERYDGEKEELLQDSFDLHQQDQASSSRCSQ